MDSTILTFELAVNNDIDKHSGLRHKKKTKDNLTPKQRIALDELKNTDDLIITQADKGGSTVIWGIEEYLQEAYSQLNNTAYYEELPSDPSSTHQNIINNSLNKLHSENLIDKATRDTLKPSNTKTARFYLLPKIHKNNNPGRPVISSVNCNTTKLSKYVDHFIQPLATQVKSYIRDTTDLLCKLEQIGTIPENAILVTMDVRALYSNIQHDKGLATLTKVLNDRLIKEPDTKVLTTLMEHVLNLNSFSFNNGYYLQTKGVAMGTISAPSYAIIYMGEFEETHIYPLIIDDTLFYGRYIDDILFIYTGGETKLHNFFCHINSCDESIKFDYETSQHSISFLDTVIYIDNNRNLQTTLYTKPTDSHNFLHASSAHPRHLINNLPYSQALRTRRICSNTEELTKNNTLMLEYFLDRGYPHDLVASQIEKASGIPREETLKLTPKSTSDRIPLITTFNDSLPPLARIIRDRWELLTMKDELRDTFKETGLISFRRPPNIKDIAASNTIANNKVQHRSDTPKTNKFCSPCNSSRCLCCKQLAFTDTFTSTVTHKTYKIFHESNCKSNHVVYLLECTLCGIQYIGKTEWSFNIRLNNYRYRIKSTNTSNLLPCEKHFKLASHDFEKDAKFTIIEKIEKIDDKTMAKSTLLRREDFWILKLNTLHPHGLNTKVSNL